MIHTNPRRHPSSVLLFLLFDPLVFWFFQIPRCASFTLARLLEAAAHSVLFVDSSLAALLPPSRLYLNFLNPFERHIRGQLDGCGRAPKIMDDHSLHPGIDSQLLLEP